MKSKARNRHFRDDPFVPAPVKGELPSPSLTYCGPSGNGRLPWRNGTGSGGRLTTCWPTQWGVLSVQLEVAVKASGTTVTEVFGVGPYVAASLVGYVVDVSRFADRDSFAAYNGTAPMEVSSAGHKVFRLSRRGNRRLNTAVHMTAVTQVSHRYSEGRSYCDRKLKVLLRPQAKRRKNEQRGTALPGAALQ